MKFLISPLNYAVIGIDVDDGVGWAHSVLFAGELPEFKHLLPEGQSVQILFSSGGGSERGCYMVESCVD